MIPFVFSNSEAPEELKADIRTTVERGIAGLKRLCEFDPYLAGTELTMADIYMRYVLSVVETAGSTKMDWDIIAEMPGLREWQAMMADSDIARKIDADREANGPEFFAYLKKRFGS
jgi:glutathione S-transferase